MLGIVMTVADVAVDHRMEGRDQPFARANACDNVEERQPVILRHREAWIRRCDIVGMVTWSAAARLDHFDMQKQTLDRGAKDECPLELGRAPRHAEIVTIENSA